MENSCKNEVYALEMKNITKRFPGTIAVSGVDFQVKKGEVHALMGENGAGKSTLMKILSGLYNDYEGDIYINGEKKELHNPEMAKNAGIGMVYQELSLARRISIYENLLVGRLPKKGIFVDRKASMKESEELLKRVGLDNISPAMEVSEISQCDAQLVEIAKVLGNKPSIIILDEPTSALSSEEVNRLYKIVNLLKEQGLAIIYISHHLGEIFEIADRVTIMRDGKKVETFPVSDVTSEILVEKMVGKSVKSFYEGYDSAVQDEEVLRVEDFTRWGFFHHINFSLKKGEILAICGLAGSGRTEIARGLVGLDDVHKGDVYVHGKKVHFKNMGEAIKGGIGYLTEDRKTVGLALPQTVADNVLTCVIDKYSNGILFNPSKLNNLVDEKIQEMSVYPPDRNRLVGSFSGGNQQKVLMAKWLISDVDILILDEPTRGVDVSAKQTIHDVVKTYVRKGISCILLSSDLPEVVGLADRAVILREGHIIGEIQKENITENELLIAANGEGKYVSCQK